MSSFLSAKVIPWGLCLAVLLCHLPAPAQDGQPALRVSLERAYQQWRSAVLAQDSRAWAASLSTYRQVMTRNQIISQRKPFPASVFAVPVEPPPIEGLRLLEAQAVGPTAHLLYFGKINMGGPPAEIPDNILMLKFFGENGAWKFDSSRLLKLSEQPEMRAQLQKGGAPDFLDHPQFTPPGKLPPVPPLCNVPEHVTGCTIQSHGYETKMTLNGFDYPALLDQSEKILVIGGLNNGANTLQLSVKPTDVPKDAERLLQVDLYIAPAKPGDAGVRVFHFESKDPNLPPTLTLPVVITPEVLSKGR